MNLFEGREKCFLFSLGRSNHWKSSIWKTKRKTGIRKTSRKSSIRKTSRNSSIRKSSNWKTSIRISTKSIESTDSIRNTGSKSRSSGKRSWSSDSMNWGRCLLGGKTSSSSIVKSSLESSLGSSNFLSISKIFSSNLSSLGICVYWSKSSMFTSVSSGKSSIEDSLGFSNLSSILNWEGSGNSQKGSNDLENVNC